MSDTVEITSLDLELKVWNLFYNRSSYQSRVGFVTTLLSIEESKEKRRNLRFTEIP